MSLICFGYSLALELKVFHLYAYQILRVALLSMKQGKDMVMIELGICLLSYG